MKLNAAQKVQLEHIAEQVSLTPLLRRLPSQLSGGQRQRVALARCPVRSQPVLLLDEPFSALDPALRNEMLALLETICEERQLTLMMVSHNTDDAARIAPVQWSWITAPLRLTAVPPHWSAVTFRRHKSSVSARKPHLKYCIYPHHSAIVIFSQRNGQQ